MTTETTARFWTWVNKTEGCWLWMGHPRTDGYGLFMVAGRRWAAHRFSYLLHHGVDPGAACVLHKCDVRPCVRPDHLFLGSKSDNAKDREAKGRGVDNSGERNHGARLTEADVRAARQARASGVSVRALCLRYGMSNGGMRHALNGLSWARIDGATR